MVPERLPRKEDPLGAAVPIAGAGHGGRALHEVRGNEWRLAYSEGDRRGLEDARRGEKFIARGESGRDGLLEARERAG